MSHRWAKGNDTGNLFIYLSKNQENNKEKPLIETDKTPTQTQKLSHWCTKQQTVKDSS